MEDIISWSAVETAEKIRERAVSCTEVVTAHLDHVEIANPHLNAIVEVHAEEALAQAAEQDKNWQAEGLPPLYGVPVTTKINIDQTGSCTSNGLPALNEIPATADSPLVTNLKQDGAIIIGRTSTPEFSIRWFTSNPIYGVTNNPWHPDITPGGSSGGAAAAVAMGMGCIAHGNDLGGSLRYPAYCCGVATIRPSIGRVAAGNPSAGVGAERPPITQTMSVQGPIARTIADVRLGLNSMARRSAYDPLWTNATSGRGKQAPWKIGWFVDAFGDGVETEVDHATRKAVNALEAAGHKLVEMPAPNAVEAVNVWGNLLFAETSLLGEAAMREMGSPEVVRVFEGYRSCFEALDLKGFLENMQARNRLQRIWNEMFEDIDVFLLPVSGQKPFLNDLDFKQPERIPEMVKAQRFLYLVNLLGLPSASVPVGIYEGMPVGVQLIGAMHDDAVCLAVAEELEQDIDFPGLL
ncbi:MAG: amidase [Thiolinea sp.]